MRHCTFNVDKTKAGQSDRLLFTSFHQSNALSSGQLAARTLILLSANEVSF
jgi:hypothetical protein